MIKKGTLLQERYRIEKHIGQGGMGSVYIATDERFGSKVAIKETLFSDDQYKKAFEREARLLNSLKHSALPKVSDHFVEDNSQYIVMEYIGGDDLFETIEKSGKAFSLDEVLNWTEQLLDALEYLHGQENPVIHRDIKPQNLKLTTHGQVVLLDFGLAKGNPTDANHQTAANSIFGYSRNYASLEQIQGTGTDPRSDLYSLAATVYHLVTGKPPADALTRVMMVLNEENDPLEAPNSINSQIPENLNDALLLAMSLNANQRPQSAEEMRRTLSDGVPTGVLQKRDTVSDRPLETNFYSKDTQVISESPEAQKVSRTEMETEVLPGLPSEQKSVKTKVAKPRTAASARPPVRKQKTETDAGVITRSFSSRRNFITAAIAGLFFLFGSVAAGVYFFTGNLFGPAVPVGNSGAIDLNSNKASYDLTVGSGNSNLTNSGNASESTELVVDSPSPAPSPSPVQTRQEVALKPTSKPKPSDTKGTNRSDTANAPDQMDFDLGDVKIKDGKIITPDVTIKDGRIISNKDGKTISTDKVDVKPKTPTRPIPRPPITREQYRRMTPAQKKKARILMERWRRRENARRAKEGLPPIPRRAVTN